MGGSLALRPCERGLQGAQGRYRASIAGRVRGDAGGGVRLVQGAVQQGTLVDVQQAGGAVGPGAAHSSSSTGRPRSRSPRPTRPPGRRSPSTVPADQVERVDLFVRGRRQPHHLAADSVGERSVLVFRVDDQVVGGVQQAAQQLELDEDDSPEPLAP